jgi:hypothetical protein
MKGLLPKLNDKERMVVDAHIEELHTRFQNRIASLLQENLELKKRNKILEDKLVRRNIA